MADLDQADVLEWSTQQSALLRRRAAGELVNEAGLDWPNIAEEIEAVGREQLHAVEALLMQALVRMLKAGAWPCSRDAPTRHGDARGFRAQARRRFVPSTAQRIDLPGIYADAVRSLPDTIDGQPPLPVPETCPCTLDDLLGDAP